MKRKLSRNKKNAKCFLFSCYLITVGLFFSLFLSCGDKSPKKEVSEIANKDSVEYYCPMHPEIHQNTPGKCPKPECAGMELVKKEDETYLQSPLKPVSSNVLSKIKLIKPEYKNLPITVEALGYIDYDSYSKFDISSRYSGRIDKLYIKFNYQPIHKGEPVFDIYSPEIVNAQENLLYLLKNSPDEKDLISSARQKLKLFQLTDEQIKEIENSGKAKNTITIFSKYDGHIHEMLSSKMSASEMGDFRKSPLISVREGMYVERGKIIFNVVNPYKAVVMLKIKASDISKVKVGQQVDFTVNSDTTMKMNGKVDFIEPLIGDKAKSIMLRVNMDNAGHKHKIGSLVNAKIISDDLETLWIPSSALIDLGKSKMVWVWKRDNFQAVKVESGLIINGWVEIADGLTESDQIAAEAHFLSDSESFIKINENENE